MYHQLWARWFWLGCTSYLAYITIFDRCHKPYFIIALVGVGLAIAAWLNPDMSFPGRTFFFIVLAGAILYHLWLFLAVVKVFQKNE